MTTKAKLFERLKNNSYDAACDEIKTLLKNEGFLLDRVTGSHHLFQKAKLIFCPSPFMGRK